MDAIGMPTVVRRGGFRAATAHFGAKNLPRTAPETVEMRRLCDARVGRSFRFGNAPCQRLRAMTRLFASYWLHWSASVRSLSNASLVLASILLSLRGSLVT